MLWSTNIKIVIFCASGIWGVYKPDLYKQKWHVTEFFVEVGFFSSIGCLNEFLKCQLGKGEMKGQLQTYPWVLQCLYLFTWFFFIDIGSRDTAVRKFILILKTFHFWVYGGLFNQYGVRKRIRSFLHRAWSIFSSMDIWKKFSKLVEASKENLWQITKM